MEPEWKKADPRPYTEMKNRFVTFCADEVGGISLSTILCQWADSFGKYKPAIGQMIVLPKTEESKALVLIHYLIDSRAEES